MDLGTIYLQNGMQHSWLEMATPTEDIYDIVYLYLPHCNGCEQA